MASDLLQFFAKIKELGILLPFIAILILIVFIVVIYFKYKKTIKNWIKNVGNDIEFEDNLETTINNHATDIENLKDEITNLEKSHKDDVKELQDNLQKISNVVENLQKSSKLLLESIEKEKEKEEDLFNKFSTFKEHEEDEHKEFIENLNSFQKTQEDNNKKVLKRLDENKKLTIENKKIADERTVTQFRQILWHMHKDFMKQGYTTPSGLKTWTELGKTYEKAGGDDIFHEKLDPEVKALEVKYDDTYLY